MVMMLDQIIENAETDGCYEKREYQHRIVQQCDEQYNEIGVRSIMIESPTGSGKTAMGLLGAKLQQDRHNIGIGWVAMRRNLLAQAHHDNDKLGIGVQDLTTISMFDNNPPTHDASGRKIELLIVDEAQHDAANSMSHIHNVIKPRWAKGLSATPYRTDRMKLCFDKVIKDIGIHQLIEQGYLSRYHLYTVPAWNPDSIATTYLREPERWGKSVMFWHKTEDAVRCVDLLRAGGAKAHLMLGAHKQSERDEALEKFETGEIDVIVNLMLLTEGFDSPSLRTVFVRDSGKGPTVQMAGRVFRKYPGVEFKNVVQSKLTRWPMVRTAIPAEQFVWLPEDHQWRSYKISKQIGRISSMATLIMARKTPEIPDIIKRNQKSANAWFNNL